MIDVVSALSSLLTASITLARSGEILILRFVYQVFIDGFA